VTSPCCCRAARRPYRVSASTASGQRIVRVPAAPGSRHVITVSSLAGDVAVLTR
jgi:hypothetical protein